MELKEAITIYNERIKDDYIKEYEEARDVLIEELDKRKPKEEYYKSSNEFDYYFELPYEEMYFTSDGVKFKQHGYNGIAKRKGESKWCKSHCLSLCNYSKKYIQELLDSDIRNDYLKEKGE